jgi:hypothetical protein
MVIRSTGKRYAGSDECSAVIDIKGLMVFDEAGQRIRPAH